jgi:CO/xanthine dehydrogenase FAD-binding subunit
MQAILGASEHCIALHASDLCVPLVALDAVAHIGLIGVAPAIANGFYHATGRRIRSLPITISQVL